jgi:DNA-binding NarL/FixJ family response regulator
MEGERGKVLVIDDSWVILESVRMALTAAGYDVRLTTEGEAATKYLTWAELVIIDFHMPGVDGASLLPALKAAVPPGATCLFYLYTSDTQVARMYEAYGFDGGFLKKGDASALPAQIDAAFRTIKLRKLATQLKRTKSGSSKPPKD